MNALYVPVKLRRSPKETAAYHHGFRAGMKHASEIAGKMTAAHSVAAAIVRRLEEQEALTAPKIESTPKCPPR